MPGPGRGNDEARTMKNTGSGIRYPCNHILHLAFAKEFLKKLAKYPDEIMDTKSKKRKIRRFFSAINLVHHRSHCCYALSVTNIPVSPLPYLLLFTEFSLLNLE